MLLADSLSPARTLRSLLLPTLLLVWISLNDLSFFFHFTVSTPSHVAFFVTVGAFEFIYVVVRFVVVSIAITANLFLSASLFGVTVLIAFVTYHGPVLVFVYSCICRFSADITVARSF